MEMLNRESRRALTGSLHIPRNSKLVSWTTEFDEEHHSHRHSFTFSSSTGTHTHPGSTSGSTNCLSDSTTHSHLVNSAAGGSHQHTSCTGYTDYTSATDLSHSHTISSGTCGSGGAAHTHGSATSGQGYCAYSGCSTHEHTHPETGTSASGGDAHSDHAITGTAASPGTGTLQSHTHPISGSLALANSHSHAVGSIAITNATCYGGMSHGHTSAAPGAKTHNHTFTDTCDLDGEPPVTFQPWAIIM